MKKLVALSLLFVAGVTFVLAQTPNEFKGHTSYVYAVALSPDGTTLATASFDNTVKLWDYKTGKEKATLKGHTAQVYSVAFSHDGNTIATGSMDKTIRLYDKEGKFVRELKGHTEVVDSLAFNNDSKLLASASGDKTVRLWNPGDAKELKKFDGHKESVYSVAFSPNGQYLASGSNDTTIRIYDVKEMKEIRMIGELPPDPKAPMKKDPKKDDKKKEEKDKDKDKKDDKDKKETKKEPLELKEIREGVNAIVFTPDSSQVLAVGFDHMLRFYNVADGKETKKIGPTPDWLVGVALSKDGKNVATAGYGGSLRVYELGS